LLPVWGWTARQGNEMDFFLSRDAPSLWARLRVFAAQSGIQSLLLEALFDANDGATTDLERLGNLPIALWGLGLVAIQLEQNACHDLLKGRATPSAKHVGEVLALLWDERHGIAMLAHGLLLARGERFPLFPASISPRVLCVKSSLTEQSPYFFCHKLFRLFQQAVMLIST